MNAGPAASTGSAEVRLERDGRVATITLDVAAYR
jgi:hypothetical protein